MFQILLTLILGVDQALAGNYTCSAKNLFGEDAITYTVEALLQPGQPVLELQYSTANSIKVQTENLYLFLIIILVNNFN